MEKPLLQYYTDEEWGYDIWDEEIREDAGISVKFQQEKDETREGFFKRLGFEPKAKMYGSDLEKDKEVRSSNWNARLVAAEQGYGLDVLINDKDKDVRGAVEDYLYYHDYSSIEAWIEDNPKKVADKKNKK